MIYTGVIADLKWLKNDPRFAAYEKQVATILAFDGYVQKQIKLLRVMINKGRTPQQVHNYYKKVRYRVLESSDAFRDLYVAIEQHIIVTQEEKEKIHDVGYKYFAFLRALDGAVVMCGKPKAANEWLDAAEKELC